MDMRQMEGIDDKAASCKILAGVWDERRRSRRHGEIMMPSHANFSGSLDAEALFGRHGNDTGTHRTILRRLCH